MWPSSTQLRQPSDCWWSTAESRCRSESRHHRPTGSWCYSLLLHVYCCFYTREAFCICFCSKSRSLCRYKRESLKILGTVGEPINAEAWHWYYSVVGEKRCPIVDTFWQTETVRWTLFCTKFNCCKKCFQIRVDTFNLFIFNYLTQKQWLQLPAGGSTANSLLTMWDNKTFLTGCFLAFQGGHVLTPLPAATPMKPGSAVSESCPKYTHSITLRGKCIYGTILLFHLHFFKVYKNRRV